MAIHKSTSRKCEGLRMSFLNNNSKEILLTKYTPVRKYNLTVILGTVHVNITLKSKRYQRNLNLREIAPLIWELRLVKCIQDYGLKGWGSARRWMGGGVGFLYLLAFKAEAVAACRCRSPRLISVADRRGKGWSPGASWTMQTTWIFAFLIELITPKAAMSGMGSSNALPCPQRYRRRRKIVGGGGVEGEGDSRRGRREALAGEGRGRWRLVVTRSAGRGVGIDGGGGGGWRERDGANNARGA
uniref:Expressed protein n=2 Tax=Oryza sativa subsp. japonica TaxID=39947 RepID=Q7XBY0_ORYSJ|nr:expressed protein [Oryza sativa Japonica Group]